MFVKSIAFGVLAMVSTVSLAAAEPPHEFTLRGEVVSVYDGDTLTLRGATGARFPIRLSDIDTPERQQSGRSDRPGQPFADDAGYLLRGLALGRQAVASCFEIERGGRPVCHVMVDGQALHREMLQAGLAWAAEKPKWRRDPATTNLEGAARGARRGLWSDTSPVPPWQWRRQCWSPPPGKTPACPGGGTADSHDRR